MTKVIETDSRVASLKDGVKKLDAKTDRLNELFMSWNEKLAGVRVAAFLSAVGPSGPQTEYTWQGGEDRWEIGWAKVGVWQMAARQLRDDVSEPHYMEKNRSALFEPAIVLMSAPRGVRILAADMFEDLVTELERELADYHEAIDAVLVPQQRVA